MYSLSLKLIHVYSMRVINMQSDVWCGVCRQFSISISISIIIIHREFKKGDTILLSISLLNIDRFSQFFHRRTQLELCNKIIN